MGNISLGFSGMPRHSMKRSLRWNLQNGRNAHVSASAAELGKGPLFDLINSSEMSPFVQSA
jgi:hypothetical protein